MSDSPEISEFEPARMTYEEFVELQAKRKMPGLASKAFTTQHKIFTVDEREEMSIRVIEKSQEKRLARRARVAARLSSQKKNEKPTVRLKKGKRK